MFYYLSGSIPQLLIAETVMQGFMKHSLSCILLLSTFLTIAQTPNRTLIEKITEVHDLMSVDNISNYFIMSKNARSTLLTLDPSANETSRKIDEYKIYVFWSKGNECFVQEFDRQKRYPKTQISDCTFLKLNSKDIDKIISENVLPIAVWNNGKINEIIQPLHHMIAFHFMVFKKSKEFPEYYLQSQDESNLNSEENSKLKIAELYFNCERALQRK